MPNAVAAGVAAVRVGGIGWGMIPCQHLLALFHIASIYDNVVLDKLPIW